MSVQLLGNKYGGRQQWKADIWVGWGGEAAAAEEEEEEGEKEAGGVVLSDERASSRRFLQTFARCPANGTTVLLFP